jgi:Tol biopolymer transport system component
MPLQFQRLLYIPPLKTKDNDIQGVIWAAWNPAGTDFAAVYDDGSNSIHILNNTTGSITQYLDTMDNDTGNYTFAWSPDGTRIAAVFDELDNSGHALNIWDITGKFIATNRVGRTTAYEVYWSPDGLKLAETEYIPAPNPNDSGSPALFIWDTHTGKLLSRHDATEIGAWSPDGKKMVVGGGKKYVGSLEIVDPATFQVLFTFPPIPRDDNFGDVAIWTPDSRQVMVNSCDYGANCTVWTWDITTGQVVKHLAQDFGTFGPNHEFALNVSGTLLASAWGYSTTVNLWDVQSGARLNSLDAGEGITSLSWQRDQDILLLGGIGGSIQVWKVTRTSALQM